MSGALTAALRLATPSAADTTLARRYLLAGELFVSAEPYAVTTVLGSCVAVGMWDPSQGLGGLNHYLLPYEVSGQPPSPRFGPQAIEQLVRDLTTLGCRLERLRAKVFGGASIFGSRDGRVPHMGLRNAALARELLGARGIPVVAEDVGGRRGRRVVFHTHDGSARVQQL